MTLWDEEFCQQLATEGYWVIRFDNRDVGLSTKLDKESVPNLLAMMQSVRQGEAIEVPYTLLDMAADTVGLLDALKIDSAHIVGVSMGGMIAQTIAIHHPERIRTLTSIMSSTGDPKLPPPKPKAASILVTTPPADRAKYIEYSVELCRILHSTKFRFDEAYIRDRSGCAYDRSYYPAGTARQLAAILASGSRKEALKLVNVPTLIIHGDADPLIPVECGIDTANTIPGAELLIIEGMGHSIPFEVAPKVIRTITRHAV